MADIELIKKIMQATGVKPLSHYSTEHIKVIPSGSLGIDIALGRGGWPRGRIVELYSELESAGKTTLILQAIANAQKEGLLCAFIDTEHALDGKYARNLGVNMQDLFFCQPDNGDQAVETLESLLKTGSFGLIVFDSVAAARPKAELEGETDDANISYHARLMGQLCKRVTPLASLHNTCCILTNQSREKPGIAYGNPIYQTGGKALKFYASIRASLKRIGKPVEDNNDKKIANEVQLTVVKNKIAPPFEEAKFQIVYGEGINKAEDLLETMLQSGHIVKKGSWYNTSQGKPVGQGREKAIEWLSDKIEAITSTVRSSNWFKQKTGAS